MNFKYFLILIFVITKIHTTLDITKEFCKTTQMPDKKCAQIRALFTMYGRFMAVNLIDKKTHDRIGYVEYYKTDDHIVRVDFLKVFNNFQSNRYGSALLKYALAQCDSKCQYSILDAVAITAPPDKKPEELQRLKKFYEKHGGKTLYEDSSWHPTEPTRARMYFSDKL